MHYFFSHEGKRFLDSGISELRRRLKLLEILRGIVAPRLVDSMQLLLEDMCRLGSIVHRLWTSPEAYGYLTRQEPRLITHTREYQELRPLVIELVNDCINLDPTAESLSKSPLPQDLGHWLSRDAGAVAATHGEPAKQGPHQNQNSVYSVPPSSTPTPQGQRYNEIPPSTGHLANVRSLNAQNPPEAPNRWKVVPPGLFNNSGPISTIRPELQSPYQKSSDSDQ